MTTHDPPDDPVPPLLEAILADTDGAAAVAFRLLDCHGTMRVDEPRCVGDERIAACAASLQGRSYASVMGGTRATVGDHLAGIGRAQRLGPSGLGEGWTSPCAELGITSAVGLALLEGKHVVGVVAVLGMDLSRDAQKALESCHDALAEALCLELPRECFVLASTPDGTLVPGCAAGSRWLSARGRAAGTLEIARRGGVLGGANLRLLPVASKLSIASVVIVEPCRLPRLPAEALLSEAQRAVARYAAAGATMAETAQAMGVATETARSHLKAVYRRLAVGSRVELAAALREGLPPWAEVG